MKILILVALILVGCNKSDIKEKVNIEATPTQTQEISKEKNLEITVLGKKFEWIFIYPNGFKVSSLKTKNVKVRDAEKEILQDNKNTMKYLTLPAHTKVTFKFKSEDVKHNFYSFKLGLGADVLPNKVTTWNIKTKSLGLFEYACHEMCGEGQHDMNGLIRVVSARDFEQFYKMTQINKK